VTDSTAGTPGGDPGPRPRARSFHGRPPEGPGLRLFFAAPVPDRATALVQGLVSSLRATEADGPVGEQPERRRPGEVRWVRLDQLHVTLRFLGPTPDERLPGLGELLQEAAATVAPFPVAVQGAGAFPRVERPRALWLGIEDPSAGLGRLADVLDRRLVEQGWPHEERPYRPHLTLARTDGVRSGPSVARRLIAAAATLDARFTVDRVVLYESLTGGGPARYVPHAVAALRGPLTTG